MDCGRQLGAPEDQEIAGGEQRDDRVVGDQPCRGAVAEEGEVEGDDDGDHREGVEGERERSGRW
jgi:hypothetical protein